MPKYRNKSRLVATALLLAVLSNATVGWTVPLEVYGRLPTIEDVVLSPDGSRLAYVRTSQDVRTLMIVGVANRKLLGQLNAGTVKLRHIQWADNDNLLIMMSVTGVPAGIVGPRAEWAALKVYNVPSSKTRAVPDPTHLWGGTRTMNVTWGHTMVRRVDGETLLFVPGYYAAASGNLRPALFRVNLASGEEGIFQKGSAATRQWLVDAAGLLAAEEDYSDDDQRWSLLQAPGGHLQEIASGHAAIDYPSLLGFGPDPDTLLVETTEDGNSVWRLLSVKDGSFGPPMAERKIMSAPIEDYLTRRMIGGVSGNDTPHYVFFDRRTQSSWDAIARAFGKDRVSFVSASQDFRKVVVRVDGPEFGYIYELIDMDTHKGDPIGDVYDGVTDPLEVRQITYEAADGLKIPAYLTLPPKKAPKNLALVVLPHGGPAIFDTAGFDWWAQALADQGYAVLQPNFRGSDLNQRFLAAGFGEFGRKMQTDLSDGVRYLVKEGIADPARVCIIGASYGGYAALAGPTLDPGIYRCAVSVSGISDLKRMLGPANTTSLPQRYWDRYMGVTGPTDPRLDEISPIKHIAAVNVPILLIHGRDDTVVSFEQSQLMFDALKHANKDVEMVTLKNEDHWLSRSETRLQMLQASVAFLRAHNPPD